MKCTMCGFQTSFPNTLAVCYCEDSFYLDDQELERARELVQKMDASATGRTGRRVTQLILATSLGVVYSALLNGLLFGMIVFKGWLRHSEGDGPLSFGELIRLGSLSRGGQEPLLSDPIFNWILLLVITTLFVGHGILKKINAFVKESTFERVIKDSVLETEARQSQT